MLDDIKKHLCATAVQLRPNMGAVECTHLVLSLILLKYVSDTFTRNQNSDPRADFVLANPPLNISDWRQGRLKGDPPLGDANYAWLQHMRHHLKPSGAIQIQQISSSRSGLARRRNAGGRSEALGCYLHNWRRLAHAPISQTQVPTFVPVTLTRTQLRVRTGQTRDKCTARIPATTWVLVSCTPLARTCVNK